MLPMTALRLVEVAQEGPEPEDVKAGWAAFTIFLLLCAAVVLLGFSLVKQLRKAQAAKDAGVYGDEPVDRSGPADEVAGTSDGEDRPRAE